MTELADVGVIGMGVMGTNLARNMARHGYKVAIWNLEPERTEQVAQQYASEGTFIPHRELKDFVASIATPRAIVLMITAGKPVDIVMGELEPLLAPGDIVMDGGNSLFTDTIRREADWAAKGLNFMGTGISGGEVGALEGPSIMPGGSTAAYDRLGPILEAISAKAGPHGDEPCVTHIGENGAGHFVKMVHNGIEYADMELIAEAYDLLSAAGLDNAQMAETFRGWNHGDLDSYLIEITAKVLEKQDPETGKPLVDVILDQAGMKGTGTWTVETALDLPADVNVIAESVFARGLSSDPHLRQAARSLAGPDHKLPADVDVAAFTDALRQALWASKVVAYAQGLDEIRKGAEVYDWKIDMGAIAKIWRAGCIIRAKLLQRISDEYASGDVQNLMVAPSVAQDLAAAQDAWRHVIATGVAAGVPLPGMTAALAYYDGARAERLPAALIQGLRDYFGSHTYARVDADGIYHINWSTDGTEVRTPDKPTPKKAEEPQHTEGVQHG